MPRVFLDTNIIEGYSVSLSHRITGEVPGRGRRRGPRRPRPAPPRREVHFALESDGWNCTFECKVHVSAFFGVRGCTRRPAPRPAGPVRSPGCPLWSSPGLGRPSQRPVPATERSVAPFPGVRSGEGCPNLPQRPGSGRSAREESLIFRAFLRGRSRPGAPLWQIWTRPRPGSPQEPHQYHPEPGCAQNNLRRSGQRSRVMPVRLGQCGLSSPKSTSARTM